MIPFDQSPHFFQTFLDFYFDRVMEACELECCLTVENLNSNVVKKRRTYKNITVVLVEMNFATSLSELSVVNLRWERLFS